VSDAAPTVPAGAGPLAGTIVLDLTHFVAGPYCTMLLADHGADVIKIERPGGEPTRHIEPKIGPDGGGISVYFARLNRNKRSVCLDLRTDDGRAVLRDLVAHADVLVENFRAGALADLGFDADTLLAVNPRLVYCSISGFGHSAGPYRERPAFAPVVEAMAGAVRHDPHGGPPLTMGLALGDLSTATVGFGAITLALLDRAPTGCGRHLDLSMHDSMLALNERAIHLKAMMDADAVPGAPVLASTPSDIFRTRDGYVCISCVGEHIWARLCLAIGHEELLDDPRLASAGDRAAHMDDVLLPVMDAWLSARTTAEVTEVLIAAGVPAGDVKSPAEVLADEQAQLRGMLLTVPTYAGIDVLTAASPIPWDGERRADPIPAAGEHTVTVLRDLLGYDATRIDGLLAADVIATAPA
jgi:crotonobetainyl-CoA:carnitine CoA-transferase CaiB-like acyl-CoA transferase